MVVWLNLPTMIWHCKGQRWYARTKHGAFACEKEAAASGARGTKNGQWGNVESLEVIVFGDCGGGDYVIRSITRSRVQCGRRGGCVATGCPLNACRIFVLLAVLGLVGCGAGHPTKPGERPTTVPVDVTSDSTTVTQQLPDATRLVSDKNWP
jgi:hypothetical protein